MVSGTCPPSSYVKLNRNGSFSGVGTCSGNTFQIQTDLSGGANALTAQVYNLTDNEGPAGSSITVYYDETTVEPSPPTPPPTQLVVANIESGNFRTGQVTQTSVTPTISGLAPPYSEIVVTFHSEPRTCMTKADSRGWWSCTLAGSLPAGYHHVDIVATTLDGQRLVFPSFEIHVMASVPNIIRTVVNPFLIQSEYAYQAQHPGQSFRFSLSVGGGKAPFTIIVEWGDHQQTTFIRQDQSAFDITHTYEEAGEYAIHVKITDANGTESTTQLAAVVRQSLPPTAGTQQGSGFSQFLGDVSRYLWVIWPVYLAVVLMVISYWIGEQEAYKRIFTRRTASHSSGSGSGKGKR